MLLGLQNHNHGSIPATGEQLCRLLDDVGSPWVVGIMDTGQWTGSPARNQGVPDPNYDTYEFMEQTAAHASYVRAKFYKIWAAMLLKHNGLFLKGNRTFFVQSRIRRFLADAILQEFDELWYASG